MDKGEQLAWVWRSKPRCNTLFISIGHRVELKSALHWVQLCRCGHRLLEPTRRVDAVASNRTAFQRWQQGRDEADFSSPQLGSGANFR